MDLRSQLPPDAPDEAAVWWATRRQLDPERFASDSTFADWLADPANAAGWHAIDERIERIGSYASMPEIREMRRAALELARAKRRPVRQRWVLGTALAASLVGAIGGGMLLWPAPRTAISSGEQVQRYATAIGQRRDVVLGDGSKVTLNTDSLVEVRYSDDRRDVRLLQGQAMFHVAKNARRPFVVAAGNRQITALGTAFDVQVKREGQVQVLLVEGSVRVDSVRRTGLARLIPALDRTDLSPGQQLVSDGADLVDVSAADVERATAWNRGTLIFRSDSLADAIKEVNRYSAVPLVVDDPAIARLKVSGIFPAADRDDFLAALEALYPLGAQNEPGGTIRLVWRKQRANQPD
ncbi:FecR family protein [Sphingomonas turrisvirgatae]|nr:FecR domain-containing protein [Sphingomonas turrisvirgatae]